MNRAVAIVLLAASAALAAPQYNAPQRTYPPCGDELVRRIDGKCVQPIITRNLFLYNAPAPKIRYGPIPYIPEPKIHYNYVFVRTPSAVNAPTPIVIPPPQQKTLIYLLSRRPAPHEQELIELPSTPSQPEVYFVNYNDGDNPLLPGGIDLQTALSQSSVDGGHFGDSAEGGFGNSREGSFDIRAGYN
uniref:Protein FAM98A-like n=1 Tax=Hirondellea gigas TaxID=1518452 RepID=A0A6A7G8W8_9CRUS